MSNKHPVFYSHAFTDERMARDFAVRSDLCSLLDLDERSNFCTASNLAAVQVDEVVNLYIFAQLYIAGYTLAETTLLSGIHMSGLLCSFLMDRSAASSSWTTRSPACPSVMGCSPV